MAETSTKHAVEASPFGTNANGSRTVSSAVSDFCSDYTTAYGSSGSQTLTVGSTTNYLAGDCIFIHYSHSTIANAALVGSQEFAIVKSVDTSTQLTLVSPLLYTYNYTAGSGNLDKSQCCRVKQYSDLTLNSGAIVTPSTYFKSNNETGGIIVVKANNLVINSGVRIHADGYGLQGRGGGVHHSQATTGTGLSGIINQDVLQQAAYYGGGGGGYGSNGGPSNGAGGGGGSLRSTYGNGIDGGGSFYGQGSTADLDLLNSTTLNMGPGGGSGSSNYDSGGPEGKQGGDGGGLIVISARSIDLSNADANTMTCTGAIGSIGVADGDCGGGGGSGGTAYLRSISIKLGTSTISCVGGVGGTATGTNGRTGGNGGSGSVKIEVCRYTGNLTAYLTYAYSFSFCGGITSILA